MPRHTCSYSRLAQGTATVGAHSGCGRDWDTARGAATESRHVGSLITPVGHKEDCYTGQDEGHKHQRHRVHADSLTHNCPPRRSRTYHDRLRPSERESVAEAGHVVALGSLILE